MKISNSKQDKISEQILVVLYSFYPTPIFTSKIALEIARDEEFVKRLLQNIMGKSLIVEVKKNPKGANYLRRSRWKMEDRVYQTYKNKQIS